MGREQIICIVCPMGCRLTLEADESQDGGYRVEGNSCRRGIDYGIEELINPTRVVTSTIRIKGAHLNRLPVRTDGRIPKNHIGDCMRALNDIEVQSPVVMGQIIMENILGTGINIIASRTM